MRNLLLGAVTPLDTHAQQAAVQLHFELRSLQVEMADDGVGSMLRR